MLADAPSQLTRTHTQAPTYWWASQLAAQVSAADEVSGGARGAAQDKHSDTHGQPNPEEVQLAAIKGTITILKRALSHQG